tara:strand:+ start:24922 stop:25749 length:828 start_codon:yes stop_codon:yes gene_type:complete
LEKSKSKFSLANNKFDGLNISKQNNRFFSDLRPDQFENKTESNTQNPYVGYSRKKQFRLMIEHLNPLRQDKILCVGVGSGREVEILVDFVDKVYGIDISEGFLNYCSNKFKQKFEGHLFDLQVDKISYNENYFDKVVCINVLPYFTTAGINNFFREMSRVMKKGGQLFVFMLNSKFPFAGLLQEQLIKKRLNDSKAIYYYRSLNDYMSAFSKYGFVIGNSEGGDFYCDINSKFLKSVFHIKWSQGLIRLMDIGGKTSLKSYYRSLYLTLTNESSS